VLFMLDPALVTTSPETVEPLVLALVDISKSMSIEDAGGLSRLAGALEGTRAFEESLGRDGGADLEIVPFSSGLHPEIDDLEAIPGAAGEGTDIAGSVTEAETMFRGRNVRAIVLFTDGRVTRGMTRPAAPPSVPVFSVAIGEARERPDISIEELLFDRVVYTGARAAVVAILRAPGIDRREIAISLREGVETLDRTTVTTGIGSAAIEATLRYTPAREGDHELRIEAGAVEGEEMLENNIEPFRVRVLKEKLRILYIDQSADWNFTFLRGMAERSERLDLEAVTWIPGRGLVLKPGNMRFDFPAGADGLERYDLVIVSDDRDILSERGNMRAMDEYVDRGGSLLVLADEHSPLLGADFAEGLLPVAPVGPRRIVSSELEVSVSDGDAYHPLALALEGRPQPPPLPARIDGFEVTGAARVPLVMRDRHGVYPLLAMQQSGRGVSAVLLGFPLWRWMLAGEGNTNAYESLLGGLITYLAEGGRGSPLTIETSRTVYRMGEPISVTAHAYGQSPPDNVLGEVMLLGGEEDRLVKTVLFEPDLDGRGYARAVISPLGPGDYRIDITDTRPGGTVSSVAAEFGVQPVSVEFLRTSRDMAFLESLAGLSGGSVVELEDAATLPGLLDLGEIVRDRREITEFRSNPLLLAAAILLMSLEWLLRKIWGLV
jgi:hypothetical protein